MYSVKTLSEYPDLKKFLESFSLPQKENEDRVPALYVNENLQMANLANQYKDSYSIHHKLSKECILRAAKNLTGHALIVGVGNASEIPLEELAIQFTKITIVDVDPLALEKTHKGLQEGLQSKIMTKVVDLTGLIHALYPTCLEICQKKTIKEAIEIVLDLIKTSNPTSSHFMQGEKVDFVVSSLLLTQLAGELLFSLNGIVREHFNGASFDFYGPVAGSILTSFSNKVQKQHLLDLLNWVKKEGVVYLADTFTESDLIRINSEIILEKGETKALVLTDLIQELYGMFSVKEFLKWDWLKSPPSSQIGSMGKSMKIFAFIMKPL